MLPHIDGSKHRWFGDERWYDLIVILDDATSEIYYAQLVEEESTRTVMAGLREVIESKGLFCALYSDRGSHFYVTPKAGEKVDKHRVRQVGRAMKELGVQMIPAYSPQARGRGERSFGTWQGRLPQELRLAGIDTVEGANAFLRTRSKLATGEDSVSELLGRLHRHHSRTSGQDRLHPLRPTRGRPLSRRWTASHPNQTTAGEPWKRRVRGSGGNPQTQVSHRSHRPLEIPKPRDSHFSTAPTTRLILQTKTRKPPSASRRGSTG
jgi:hypothetical protein